MPRSVATESQRRFPFTTARLQKAQPPAKGTRYVYDSKTPGLAMWITANGVKTFCVYRKIDGRPQRVRLGRFPDLTVMQARQATAGIIGEIADGRNPAAERQARRESPTLQALFDYWWMHHSKPHKKTAADDVRIFDKYLADLKGRRLEEIHKADVQAWHTKLGEKHGPYQANRARALLSAMYGSADDLGYTGRNPCQGVRKFKEQTRDRFLQPDELRPFFEALAQEDDPWRDFFLLCLFTGARRGNVAGMRWQDVDLAAGAWYLPGEEMKAGEAVVVVLPQPAVEVLRSRLEGREDSPWVFPAPSATGHIVDPRKAWERIRKASGLADLRMHDLRRSLGSWQAAAGASLQTIGASLGHRDYKSTLIYSRLQLDPVRQSVEQAVAAMETAGKLPGPKQEEGPDNG